MDLHRHPDVLDALAAEYAIGTLRGAARRRFERLGERDAAIRQAIVLWQRRIQVMGELVPPVPPPDSVWRAIERHLGLNRDPRAAHHPARVMARGVRWFENLNLWRGWAIVSTVTAALALAVALHAPEPAQAPGTQAQQHIAYMSVLNDKQAHPALLATWDEANGTLTVRRLASYPLRSDQALELWGLPTSGHPVSLGVVPADTVVTMKMRKPPKDFPALAVTVEPPGGSPNPQGPTGPVIYSGKLVPTT